MKAIESYSMEAVTSLWTNNNPETSPGTNSSPGTSTSPRINTSHGINTSLEGNCSMKAVDDGPMGTGESYSMEAAIGPRTNTNPGTDTSPGTNTSTDTNTCSWINTSAGKKLTLGPTVLGLALAPG